MHDGFVALAASPQQASLTQAKRDARRIQNAARRFAQDSESILSSQDRLKTLLEKAWRAGELLGNAAARRQASSLKESKPSYIEADRSVYRKLLSDLKKIIREEKAGSSRLKWRISLVLEAAVKQSANTVLTTACERLSESSLSLRKRWLTTSPAPCSHCAKLSGTVVDVDESFPESFDGIRDLGVYRGSLDAPPRHPNCSCIIVFDVDSR